MKQILPLLFLFLLMSFPRPVLSAIDFQIGSFEKVNDYYSVDAVITGAATGSSYYIQAVITKPDPTGYFGFTWSQKGEWFQYVSSPEKDFIAENFPILEIDRSTKILFRPDIESSKYKGPGEYLLKLRRYTGNSTGHSGESNALTVTLSESSPTPDPTSAPSPTAIPSPVGAGFIPPAPSTTKTPTKTPTKSPSPVIPTGAEGSLSPVIARSDSDEALPAGRQESPDVSFSSNSSELILGDSTTSSPVGAGFIPPVPSTHATESAVSANHNPPYKTIFIIGALVTAVSGCLLYFRLRSV